MALSIFAPTTGTFAPGNETIGFATGSDLPTELASWEPYGTGTGNQPTSALVYYSGDYDPALTYNQVKYWFICRIRKDQSDESLILGAAVVNNATLSQTARIIQRYDISFLTNGTGGASQLWSINSSSWRAHNNAYQAILTQQNGDGDAVFNIYTNDNGGAGNGQASVSIESTTALGAQTKGAVVVRGNDSGNEINKI